MLAEEKEKKRSPPSFPHTTYYYHPLLGSWEKGSSELLGLPLKKYKKRILSRASRGRVGS